MKTGRNQKMKTAQRKHTLQVRITKSTLADIDCVIATLPQLSGFDRSKFCRAAVMYCLECLAEAGYERDGAAAEQA